jgi:hypothetical protein
MKNFSKSAIAAFGVAALLLTACGDDAPVDTTPVGDTTTEAPAEDTTETEAPAEDTMEEAPAEDTTETEAPAEG